MLVYMQALIRRAIVSGLLPVSMRHCEGGHVPREDGAVDERMTAGKLGCGTFCHAPMAPPADDAPHYNGKCQQARAGAVQAV